MSEFKLPDVGEGLTEAEIVAWKVKVGDTIEINDMVVEIETAKSLVELPSPYAGTVTALLVPEGETVPVGTPIISVGAAGEARGRGAGGRRRPTPDGGARADPTPTCRRRATRPWSATAPARSSPSGGPARAPRRPSHRGRRRDPDAGAGRLRARRRPVRRRAGGRRAGRCRRPRPGPPSPRRRRTRWCPSGPTSPSATRALAKPPVRKLAKDLGVDLATLTADRAERHRHPRRRRGRRPASAGTSPRGGRPGDRRRRPRHRRARDPRADQGRAQDDGPGDEPVGLHRPARHRVGHRRRHRARWSSSSGSRRAASSATSRSRPLLVLSRAVMLAMRRTPEINSFWDEAAQEVVYKHYVNLGIAAATPRGLVVPNVKDADALSLVELAQALGQLTATARDGKTQPAEMSGGTFTITNVGVFGVDAGTPIINPGESAILCFGAVRKQPWVVTGADGEDEWRSAQRHHAGAVLRPPPHRRREGLALPRRRRRHPRGPGHRPALLTSTPSRRRLTPGVSTSADSACSPGQA